MGGRPIIPVRVWMGYALASPGSGKARQRFYEDLGRIFMPATVQMMAPLGLTAYIPGVVPPSGCADVPDEVALVFYESTGAYAKACVSCTAGRAYGLLHRTVFDFEGGHRPPSHSGFPVLFEPGAFAAGLLPYTSLFAHTGNWQTGAWRTAVLLLGDGQCDSVCARGHLARRLADLQASPPRGLAAAFTAMQGTCVVLWTRWTGGHGEVLVENLPGVTIHCALSALHVAIPMDPEAQYAGLGVGPGSSFSFRFRTRAMEITKKEKQCLSD